MIQFGHHWINGRGTNDHERPVSASLAGETERDLIHGSSPLSAKRFSMSVILSKIRNQTGEVIFPATPLGKFTR